MSILDIRYFIFSCLRRARSLSFRSNECGQDLTECALVSAAIALGLIVSTHSLAVGISTELTNVSQVVVTGKLPANQLGGGGSKPAGLIR